MDTKGTLSYDASDAVVLTNQAQSALNSAHDIIIDSQTMYEVAADDLRGIKALQKTVEEKRTAITGPLNAALKAVNDLFRGPSTYLTQAEAKLKTAMVNWVNEQQRLADIARREAEAKQRAERERLEAEAKAKAAEAQVAADAGDAEAAAEAEAEAQSIATTAQILTIQPAAVEQPKVAGIAQRVTYSANVTSLSELIRAVADGHAPLECLVADMKFLNAQSRAFKKEGTLFPGVVAVAEKSFAAKAA